MATKSKSTKKDSKDSKSFNVSSKEELEKAFQAFELSPGTGQIDLDNLKHVLQHIGPNKLSRQEVQTILSDAGIEDKRGIVVNYNILVKLLMQEQTNKK